MKFIHAADIHLDSPLRGLEAYEGAPAEEIRLAPRRALTNLVDLAIAEQAGFVIIAGDLYDGDWRDFNTGLFFVKQMARVRDAGIQVFIVRGNHDAQSQITRDLRLPDNVRVFSADEAESFHLDQFGVALHGRSFAKPAVYDDLAAGYPAPVRGVINIGVLHTALSGHPEHERYAPCEPGQLIAAGYDYWALGHVHQRCVVSERPWIIFPGNLQARHMRETGDKGCTLVTVENGSITAAEHRAIDVVRFAKIAVDVQGVRAIDEAIERAIGSLAAAVTAADRRTLCAKIGLRGGCAAHASLVNKRAAFLQQLRAAAFELAGDGLWIERIELEVGPEAEPAEPAQAAVSEIHAVVKELQTSRDTALLIKDTVEPMLRRLPLELRQRIESDDLADGSRLLNEVEQILSARLTEQEERA